MGSCWTGVCNNCGKYKLKMLKCDDSFVCEECQKELNIDGAWIKDYNKALFELSKRGDMI